MHYATKLISTNYVVLIREKQAITRYMLETQLNTEI